MEEELIEVSRGNYPTNTIHKDQTGKRFFIALMKDEA